MTGTIICGIIAIGCFAFSIMQFKEKGFLLNNAYIYASKEERQKMNKKPYYRQTGTVFLLIGIIFVIDAVDMTIHSMWLKYPVIALAIVAVIYAIVSSVKIKNTSNGN